MGKAQEKYEQPATLEAALETIHSMKNVIKTLEDQVADLKEDEGYCPNCEELESQLEEAEERAKSINRHIDDLVAIRHAIKRGSINDDHLYRVETILSHLDSGWMCRA